MTTINDISDLVQVLQDRPDWLAVVRNLVLGDDVLNLPQQLARFAETTEENFRLMQARSDRFAESTEENLRQIQENFRLMQAQLDRFAESTEQNFRLVREEFQLVYRRLDLLEGKAGNFEGATYERRVRTRVLFRLKQTLGMGSPAIVMHQEGMVAPEINRIFDRAMQSGAVRQDEIADLQETDIIITDQASGDHVVIEVSITADNDDILRAERRARVMGLASGAPAKAVVATANLHDPQQSLANDRGVTALVFPNRYR